MATAQRDAQPLRDELERVLSSTCFARRERLSKLLRFLVERQMEGKEQELKESLIGVEVFGRRPDYDPKLDSTVRSEAVRLRARLSEYYSTEGRQDPLVIELPKGGYVPRVRAPGAMIGVQRPSTKRLWRVPRPGWRKWIAGALVTVTIAIATVAMVRVGMVRWRVRPGGASPSVAVLPLENLGHDPARDYFADQLTEEIIRNLSVIDGLTVRSRTSSFALKGQRLNAADAGRQLRADYLVEGSVLLVGKRLRVNAELIRVADDFHVWSDQFDRELTDVFAIEDEISRGIVNGLRLKLRPGRRQYETNLEAYDLYLRGRQVIEGFPANPATSDVIADRAIQFFEQAIDKDPNYAIAYAGAADVLLAVDRRIPNPEAYRRAKAAAEKAVELDPGLSEAQSALASIRARDYAWRDAEQGFRRAIDLDPNNALAHLGLGWSVLVVQGRFEEGLRETHAAVALDPLSPYVNTLFGRALVWAGRYDEAVDQLRHAIELDPGRLDAYRQLGIALFLQGKSAQAQAVQEQAIAKGALLPGTIGYYSVCDAKYTGHPDEALTLFRKLLADSSARPPARYLAQIHACVGDEEHAAQYLEKAIAQHEPGLAEMLQHPCWPWMRTNPLFAPLRKALNLAP
jgi:TolB-like protein/tetratricopeptide (TPR) repeat protein